MRRMIRNAQALAPLAMVAMAPVAPVHATAPMAHVAQPGYYRFHIGTLEVTALSDGTLKMPIGKLLSIGEERTDQILAQSHIRGGYEMSFNAYLINTGRKLILVDTGAGAYFGSALGHLTESMRTSGYRPEQVDEIYLTHMHEDHIGGLVHNGTRAFPNAIVRAEAPEGAYWLDPKRATAAPEDAKAFFKAAGESLKPYIDAGRFKPFTGNAVIQPGISARSLAGHTPGHSAYVIESDGQRLELWGDTVHAAEVQFPDPTVTIAFDTDPKAAEATRDAELKDLAAKGTIIGAAHVSFPGLGRVRADGKGYRWVPLPYSSQP